MIRKAYGAAAFLMMQTRAQGGDLVLAVKGSQIGAMGQKASAIVHKTEHMNLIDEEVAEASLLNAYEKGVVDEIIHYEDIRSRLSHHLRVLVTKKPKKRLPRKHFIEP